MKYRTQIGEYKGHRLIEIYHDGTDKKVISFGEKKAAAVIECIDEIEAFLRPIMTREEIAQTCARD